ncbi:histidine phosphatase family protein [Candidatus Saccharibacteria bacterium]|nr:histidine phosphatase family protein [Candidatus Saccharibacteria bacterium]
MKLYFVRHGQSTMNQDDLISGWASDPELTEQGKSQAVAVGQELRGRNIDAIFTSGLRRVDQTALIIRDQLDPKLPVFTDWLLYERWHGDMESRPWTDDNFQKISNSDRDFCESHGIETDNLVARARAFLDNLQLMPVEFHNIVVATSGGIMWAVSKIANQSGDKIEFQNTEINEYDLRKDKNGTYSC